MRAQRVGEASQVEVDAETQSLEDALARSDAALTEARDELNEGKNWEEASTPANSQPNCI